MSTLPPDLETAARLGGEMGRRFAAKDWSAHPLGPVDGWPAEVRAAVAVTLTSRFPIVLWLGAEDLFLVYNDAYIAALGDKHPAALGARGRDVWWDIWEPIGPMLSGVLTTGQATWSDDLMLALVDEGKRQERYFTFSYSPMTTAEGAIDGIFCAVTETTERVLAARRLHLLNAVSAALMGTHTAADAVGKAVDACDNGHPDLPFVAVYLGEELQAGSRAYEGRLPRTLNDLKYADDLPEALVLPLTRPGQEDIGALVVGINPMRELDEQYRGFCGLLADQIAAALATVASYETERARADALAELDQAKTAFLTNVSHEFRTPLTLLLGPVSDAIAHAAGDGAQRERLELAQRNARRLLRLVNSLLDFSRIEAGRADPHPVALDVGALTAQIASSFTEVCHRAGLDLILACRTAIARVDVAMWETIVLNLVSNAVKYTLSGSVTVTVEPVPDAVRVTVADTGIGIDAADLPRVFERFYRASGAAGRSVEGSGVGLSMVRSMVELHGGTVGVASEPGIGTAVTIELPAPPLGTPVDMPSFSTMDSSYVAEAQQWIPAIPAESEPQRDRPLVLIAEDNLDMRLYLRQILEPRWDTVAYADGRSALAGVRRHQPDIVLADVMMPGMDGFALVGAIRSDPAIAATPVVILSARAGVEASGDGLAAGADDYLTKPFSSTDLINRLQARLDAAARQRRLDPGDRARREAATAAATAAMAAADSVETALAALMGVPEAALGASAVAIGLLDEDRLTVHYGGSVAAELRQRYHVIALRAPVPIADVAVSGRPMVIPDTADLDSRYAQVVRDAAPGVRSAVIHPLRDGNGSIIGAMALLWRQPQVFTDDGVRASAELAAVTAAAVARIRTSFREHRIATDFQEQLLDLDRSAAAVAISALYQPAAETMRVGGDWYLATALGEQRLAASVGDVVGNGLPAATIMSRLRAATASSALSDPDPIHVLSAVQRYATTVPGARCCTLAYAVVDRERQRLDYVCAGHPYPLLLTPDGEIRLLDGGRQPALDAFGQGIEGPAGQAGFPPGSLLVLYTDGLIERRGESIDSGFARLVAAAATVRDMPAGMVCRELQRRMAPPDGYSDDVVLMAVRPTGRTATSFVGTIPAATAYTRPLRHDLTEWLSTQPMTEQQCNDVVISVGEAIANAIQHGSGRDPDKAVSLEVFARPDRLTATVTDSGRWTADSAASRRESPGGRGLTLMHGLSERVHFERTNQGTEATLHYDLRREARTAGGRR